MRPRRRRTAIRVRALAVAAAALLSIRPGSAPARRIDQTAGAWLTLNVTGDVHPRVRLGLFTSERSAGFREQLLLTQIRVVPAIGVKLAKEMHGWIGYVWAPNAVGGFVRQEHRIMEQWTYSVPALPEGFRLALRARLEQRFRPAVSDDVGVRLRLLADGAIPFAARGKLRVNAWDEVFFALNDAANADGLDWQSAGFSENRAFLGLELGAGANVRVAAGYLNQWLRSQNVREPDLMNHFGALTADVRIP